MLNVFHAGDGNLHPLLVYDAREPGVTERVHLAGEEIVRASVEAGGVLSGEHGIGLEKRDYMPLMFSEVDLAAQQAAAVVRSTRIGLANPGKVLPSPACVRRHPCRAGGRMDLSEFAEEIGSTGPVTIAGLATRGGPVDGVRTVMAPVGIDWMQARRDDGAAAAPVHPSRSSTRRWPPTASRWRSRRPAPSEVRWRSGTAVCADSGTARSVTPCCRPATSTPDGEIVKAGGPTVKNVSGFDLCRLLVGSHGTLGFLGDVILRTRPRASVRAVVRRPPIHPTMGLGRLYRPTSVLWDGAIDVGAARG